MVVYNKKLRNIVNLDRFMSWKIGLIWSRFGQIQLFKMSIAFLHFIFSICISVEILLCFGISGTLWRNRKATMFMKICTELKSFSSGSAGSHRRLDLLSKIWFREEMLWDPEGRSQWADWSQFTGSHSLSCRWEKTGGSYCQEELLEVIYYFFLSFCACNSGQKS